MNFAMFPTDKGASVSPYVAKIEGKIRAMGFQSELSSMGTIVETENISQALSVIENTYNVLEPDCDRVYVTVSLDIRKGKSGRIKSKIESVESKLKNNQ